MASLKLMLVCVLFLMALTNAQAARVFLLDDGIEDQEAAESSISAGPSVASFAPYQTMEMTSIYNEQEKPDNFEVIKSVKIYHDPEDKIRGAVSVQNFIMEHPPDNESIIIERIIDTDTDESTYQIVTVDGRHLNNVHTHHLPLSRSLSLDNDDQNSRMLRVNYFERDSAYLPVEHKNIDDGLVLDEENLGQQVNGGQWMFDSEKIKYKQAVQDLKNDENLGEVLQDTASADFKPIVVADFITHVVEKGTTNDQQTEKTVPSSRNGIRLLYTDKFSKINKQKPHSRRDADSQNIIYDQNSSFLSRGVALGAQGLKNLLSFFTSSPADSYGSASTTSSYTVPTSAFQLPPSITYGSKKPGSRRIPSITYGIPQKKIPDIPYTPVSLTSMYNTPPNALFSSSLADKKFNPVHNSLSSSSSTDLLSTQDSKLKPVYNLPSSATYGTPSGNSYYVRDAKLGSLYNSSTNTYSYPSISSYNIQNLKPIPVSLTSLYNLPSQGSPILTYNAQPIQTAPSIYVPNVTYSLPANVPSNSHGPSSILSQSLQPNNMALQTYSSPVNILPISNPIYAPQEAIKVTNPPSLSHVSPNTLNRPTTQTNILTESQSGAASGITSQLMTSHPHDLQTSDAQPLSTKLYGPPSGRLPEILHGSSSALEQPPATMFSFVKTDYDGNVKWGVRHSVGN